MAAGERQEEGGARAVDSGKTTQKLPNQTWANYSLEEIKSKVKLTFKLLLCLDLFEMTLINIGNMGEII